MITLGNREILALDEIRKVIEPKGWRVEVQFLSSIDREPTEEDLNKFIDLDYFKEYGDMESLEFDRDNFNQAVIGIYRKGLLFGISKFDEPFHYVSFENLELHLEFSFDHEEHSSFIDYNSALAIEKFPVKSKHIESAYRPGILISVFGGYIEAMFGCDPITSNKSY